MNENLSLNTKVVITPLQNGLSRETRTLDVLVRVQAPDAPAGSVLERPPQALALVLDRSGSMSGRPLAEARRCAEYVVGRLRPTDIVSVVAFDNRVAELHPPTPVGSGDAIRQAIGQIVEGGNTNLHGGWRKGADGLAALQGQALRRVILLSDGQANEGVTELAEIAAQCGALAAAGVTTSTYGLGRSFNEDLMVEMARAGRGNSYYGDTAEDLMDPFVQELDLLGNLCLKGLRLSVNLPEGVVATMLNDLPFSEGTWRLPDLAWGAEAWAVLRLSIDGRAIPAQGSQMLLVRALVSAMSLNDEQVQIEQVGLSVPVLSAEAFDALAADELVRRRIDEVEAAAALKQVRESVLHGDWSTADRLIAQAQARYGNNEWVAAVLRSMAAIAERREQQLMLKESRYSAARMSDRLAAREESMRYSPVDESAPSFLRRKPQQGKGGV